MGKGDSIDPRIVDAPWKRRVLEDSVVFSEYGLPFDLRELPQREYQAHVELLRGRNEERQKEQDEADKQAQQLQRGAS